MPQSSDSRAIGVFDSGIGGLTTVRELFMRLPRESVVYFGDTARLPYGNKSGETVTRFSLEIASFLVRQPSRPSWSRATPRRATRWSRCASDSACR